MVKKEHDAQLKAKDDSHKLALVELEASIAEPVDEELLVLMAEVCSDQLTAAAEGMSRLKQDVEWKKSEMLLLEYGLRRKDFSNELKERRSDGVINDLRIQISNLENVCAARVRERDGLQDSIDYLEKSKDAWVEQDDLNERLFKCLQKVCVTFHSMIPCLTADRSAWKFLPMRPRRRWRNCRPTVILRCWTLV